MLVYPVSCLGFLSSSYHLMDLYLLLASILMPALWTFFNVYIVCWIYSRGFSMTVKGPRVKQ